MRSLPGTGAAEGIEEKIRARFGVVISVGCRWAVVRWSLVAAVDEVEDKGALAFSALLGDVGMEYYLRVNAGIRRDGARVFSQYRLRYRKLWTVNGEQFYFTERTFTYFILTWKQCSLPITTNFLGDQVRTTLGNDELRRSFTFRRQKAVAHE